MTELPSSATLTKLVSGVTETMFGMTFELAAGNESPPWKNQNVAWRTVVLPITGQRPLTVAIASDSQGGKMLAGEMFSCPAEEADATMIDDALSELLNIIAGQVKSSMGLEQTLGLPKMLESETMPMGWHSATLKHDESAVLIWVALNEPGQPGSGP